MTTRQQGNIRLTVPPNEFAKFKRDLRALANETGRDAGSVMRDAMRQAVGMMSAYTYPRTPEQGNATVRGDVLKVAFPVANDTKQDDTLSQQHQTHRRRGVVPRAIKPKLAVKQQKLFEYVAAVQKHVGRLKGGWNAAARIWGVRVPDWVWRHGAGEGTAKDAIKPDGSGYLETINDVPYARGKIDDIVRLALRNAARNITVKLRKAVEANSKKFNAKQ